MSIGAFAHSCGLTVSAVRFYADAGLLPPVEVDPTSGYRYYCDDQVGQGVTIRRLREIDMPLAAISELLSRDPSQAATLIDAHIDAAIRSVDEARLTAAAVKESLTSSPRARIATVHGPSMAAAIEQVLTATASPGDPPILRGLRLEAEEETVTLTATDRYRLSTRTLVPVALYGQTWRGTLHSDDLRGVLQEARRSTAVHLETTTHDAWLTLPDHTSRHCRLLPGDYPDHRLLLSALDPVTTRATIRRDALLEVLEQQSNHTVVRLQVDHTGILVSSDDGSDITLTSAVDGPALTVVFALTTLYPAISSALGPDIMLDLRSAELPATIRSADAGDLTTLAMPVDPDHSSRGTP
ncbi:MerR family transcriptional regulator [Aeromicrobium sp. CF4.19]|uniref:DNA polymerase III subunit beta family protein n=1 Tax=Aeromicrobium sp. CF4.19 TaxID=3373082 RepID=UPI003EE73DAE